MRRTNCAQTTSQPAVTETARGLTLFSLPCCCFWPLLLQLQHFGLQYSALTLTGLFFSRYAMLVNPINYMLCSVNIALFGSR